LYTIEQGFVLLAHRVGREPFAAVRGSMPPTISIDTIVDKVNSHLATRDGVVVRRAYEVALQAHQGQDRLDGSPYISHPMATADILAGLGMDPDTVAAGLLHDVLEDTPVTLEQLTLQFGVDVAALVDGVTKLSRFEEANVIDAKAESLRKMFLAMAEDVRVVIIKLADRLHNMRTLGAKEGPSQNRIAQETMDIYAPLAARLGIWQIKWELEDLCFRYLEPQTYREIRRQLQVKRAEREAVVQQVIDTLKVRLKEEGIQAEINGRPKHIYSIYRKMQRKNVPFDQIFDLIAVRVLLEDKFDDRGNEIVLDCYAVLGIVHSLWDPIPGEFDDYIARPKGNMYRSLHTAVQGPLGPVEVQIRTRRMHDESEYGVAAHWRYKEAGKADAKLDKKIAWLRQMLEWRKDVENATDYVEVLKSDVFRDQVYVFTPKNEIVELPTGSTPIDFAYHVHSEVGHRCRGALVNGRIVPLDYQLHTGERVEIRMAKQGGPSRDWLNPNLGYTRSARAKEKIRAYFRRQERDENIRQGRELLEKELKRLGFEKGSYETVARLFKFERLEDFLAAVGAGDINPVQIATRLDPSKDKEEELQLPTVAPPAAPLKHGATLDGVGNMETRIARCCNPVPGEEVIAFVTSGRGLTLHRRDCKQLARLDPARLHEIIFPADGQQVSPIAIRVDALDRPGLVRDIADVISNEKVNMTAVTTTTNQRQRTAVVNAVLEVTGLTQLSRILDKVSRLPNVIEVQRV
jgi:GTP pyrophosphokinase